MILGDFVDDYGERYRVSELEWVQLPRGRYHIVRWNVKEQYAIARNDSANRSAPGRWTRIDWIGFSGMPPYDWGFCYSAFDAPTEAAAVAADSVVRRATPRTGCNGFPFSRMRRVDAIGPLSGVVSAAPARRSGFGFVYDAARSRLVLFGGADSAFTRLGDTWEWSEGRWTERKIPGPAPRSNFAMAYDSKRKRVVLFGGRAATGLSRETWEFDGDRWLLLDSAGPPARQLTSMAFDAARGRMVLFGGSTGGKPLDDTWEWDGRSWQQARPSTSPPGRASHSLVYEANRNRTLLIGGYADNTLRDTWEWDGATWAKAGDGPLLLHMAAAFDESLGRVVVFGGFGDDARLDTLRTFDGTRWQAEAAKGPVARAEHRGAYAPGLGFLIFGGIGGQEMSVEGRGKSLLNDLWTFDGRKWSRLVP